MATRRLAMQRRETRCLSGDTKFPQGDWHEEAGRFRTRDRADVLALVSKDVPSPKALKGLTDHVAIFEGLDRDGGEAVFRWLASVAAMSRLL